MNALRKRVMVARTGRPAGWSGETAAGKRGLVAVNGHATAAHKPEGRAAVKARRGAAKSIALLAAAPFVGLAYVIASPLIGVGMLAWMGARVLMKYGIVKKVAVFLKNVLLFFAAPFVGLAYTLAFPIIGIAMLVRAAWRAPARPGGRA